MRLNSVRERAARARMRGDDGFSLTEVIVSLVILAIIVSATVATIISASRGQELSRQQDAARQLANSVVESAQATPWAQLGFTDAEFNSINSTSCTVDGADLCSISTMDTRKVLLNSANTSAVTTAPNSNRPARITRSEVGGIKYLIRTDITWDDTPTSAKTSEACCTKRVVVKVSWLATGVGGIKELVTSSGFAADPREAVYPARSAP